MNLTSIKSQLAALKASMPVQAPLPAGYIDPITEMLRARIASGDSPATATTPEAIATARASLTTRLEEAGRTARGRAWA
jgi:hypothetical protein